MLSNQTLTPICEFLNCLIPNEPIPRCNVAGDTQYFAINFQWNEITPQINYFLTALHADLLIWCKIQITNDKYLLNDAYSMQHTFEIIQSRIKILMKTRKCVKGTINFVDLQKTNSQNLDCSEDYFLWKLTNHPQYIEWSIKWSIRELTEYEL